MTELIKDINDVTNSDEFNNYQEMRKKALATEALVIAEVKKKERIELSTAAIKEGFMTFQNAMKLSNLTCDELKAASDLKGIEISPEELKTAKDADKF
jgi:hypothetical protein